MKAAHYQRRLRSRRLVLFQDEWLVSAILRLGIVTRVRSRRVGRSARITRQVQRSASEALIGPQIYLSLETDEQLSMAALYEA